ncbi:MAG: hypothetical protein NTX45_01180 [Proteobacteria bacterium]|nr:hypothetical protein [Pseudomonadota bacterium]
MKTVQLNQVLGQRAAVIDAFKRQLFDFSIRWIAFQAGNFSECHCTCHNFSITCKLVSDASLLTDVKIPTNKNFGFSDQSVIALESANTPAVHPSIPQGERQERMKRRKMPKPNPLYKIRGFTGHLMIFYYAPCAFFLARKQKL